MINKKNFYLGGLIILSLNLVWLIFGQDSFVLIHDNLDSEFVYIKLLLESGNVLGFDFDGQINGIMNGINRSYFRSGFNLTILLFSILPPFIAYVLNHALVHLIGYAGMYLLLKKYLVKENDILALAVSLIFGLVSYYHIQYGVSISGQPLLLFSFLNILNNEKKYYNWLIIFIFPFYSFLPVTLPFILPFLFIIGGIDYYNTRKIPLRFLMAICMLVVVNLLVEFNLLYSSLILKDVMHRVEFIMEKPNISSFLNQMHSSIKYTHYHAGKMWVFPIIGFVVLSLFFNKKLKNHTIYLLYSLLFVLIMTTGGNFISYYLGDKITLLKSLQVNRFYFLAPMLWLLLLATVLNEIDWQKRIQRYSAILILLFVLRGTLLNNFELMENIRLNQNQSSSPTFRQFFAQEMFKEIKDLTDSDSNHGKYNVISIGMHPSIAQYNNLNSLDSYQNNYSLEYKNKFRKIIAPELIKSTELQSYFDDWGSRCYAFSSQLGKNYEFSKKTDLTIPIPNYDWKKFKDMNGKYILSSIEMNVVGTEQVTYMKSFESQNSFRKIWLYKVN